MEGSQRRKSIIALLESGTVPVSGTELAKKFGVSRQVIVQDIALLRAENRNILSTNKGYILFQPHTEDKSCKAVIWVRHTQEQVLDEMSSIVELGGRMLNVSVDHELYGQIQLDLVINDMEDARDFVNKMEGSRSKPLCALTGDYHYHMICAPSEKVLSLIKEELRQKGYLAE